MSPERAARPGHDDAEVLDHGGRARWPARRVATLLAAALALVGLVGVADRAAREREQRALAGCEAAANQAVDRAWAPVVAMAGYVRPTLAQVPAGRTRQGIFDLVAEEAENGDKRVADAADRCASVPIWWHHVDLRRERDRCAAALTLEAGRLLSVADDGRAAFERETQERCGG
jgi:hypothetical protein